MPKVAIVGSRTWKDAASIAAVVDALPPGTVVVSGAAPGADRLAAQLARARGLEVVAIRADWRRGRHAGMLRNVEVIAQADQVIAFWDGRSPGTKNAIRLARQARKPLRVIRSAADPEHGLGL